MDDDFDDIFDAAVESDATGGGDDFDAAFESALQSDEPVVERELTAEQGNRAMDTGARPVGLVTRLSPTNIEGTAGGNPRRAIEAGTVSGGDQAVTDIRLHGGNPDEPPVDESRLGRQPIDLGGGARIVPDEQFGSNSATHVELPSWVRHIGAFAGGGLSGLYDSATNPDDTPWTYSPGAFASKLSQVPTLGHTDELSAAAAAAGGGDYEAVRDSFRQREDDAQERHPNSALAGSLVGSIPMMMIPGAGGASVSRLGRAGWTLGEGAGAGALMGLGESDEAPGAALAEDVLEGGGMGLLASGALQGGGAALGRISNATRGAVSRLRDRASRERLSALGARTRDIADINEQFPGGVSAAAEAARRQGLTGVARTPEGFANDIAAAEASSGARVGELLEEAEAGVAAGGRVQPPRNHAPMVGDGPGYEREAGSQWQRQIDDVADSVGGYREPAAAAARPLVSVGAVTSRMEEVLAPLDRNVAPEARQVAERMRRVIRNTAEEYPDGFTAEAFQVLKRNLAEQAKFNRSSLTPQSSSVYRDFYTQAARALDEAVEQAGAASGNPQLRSQFQEARGDYQLATRAAGWAEDWGQRQAGGSPIGMLDLQAASTATNPITGAMQAIGARMGRNRSHSIQATGFEAVANLLQRNPAALGRHAEPLARAAARGPEALRATYYVLMQRDPQARREIEAATENDGEQPQEQRYE